MTLGASTNRAHWEDWASTYGSDLRATTKCHSIKRLELEAISRHIDGLGGAPAMLEVGCGNGYNGLALANRHPELRYLGLDFSAEMIGHAVAAVRDAPAQVADRVAFHVGDARRLAAPLTLDGADVSHVGAAWAPPVAAVDLVLTNRMLINLASADEQLDAMRRIRSMLVPGGRFLMLENSVQTHARLNDVRVALGLPVRPAAQFNHFIDERAVIAPFAQEMTLRDVEDLGAIHDLLLYAVEPKLSDGEVTYDSPLLTVVTEALLALGRSAGEQLPFGQNRLWVWERA